MNDKLLCFFILTILNITFAADILVTLPNGIIRGREAVTVNSNPFYAFQKIPFAKPPLGDLRFQPPAPPDNWDGILNTTENPVVCFQMSWDDDQESEDCLYLNVYTPALPDSINETLPVMLFIYGGGFVEGDCTFSNCGPEFLIDNGVVVVTINYRVGPFGFLSTQDMVIPGNAGLKDQQFAINWTHSNVKLFGGDPDKITIFGESAGGASIAYQLLHTKSEGLFRGAIIQSGSFLSPWAYQRNARSYAFKTAALINETFNDIDDSETLLQYLLQVPARDLDAAAYQLKLTENLQNRQLSQGFFYAPVIEPEHEGAFLTKKMYGSLKAGNFVQVPTMMGIDSEECIFEAGNYDGLRNSLQSYDDNLDWLVPDDMLVEDPDQKIEIGAKIRQVYCGEEMFHDNLPQGVKYFTDDSFTRSVIRHAELQSQFTDVYFYQFSYDGIIGNNSISIEGADKVSHGEELRYIWRIYFPGYDNSDLSVFPESDVMTHHRVQALWTNFAKFLNPTPEETDVLQNITWPLVSGGNPGDFLFLDIGENLEIKNHPKEASYKGWVDIYDSLGYDKFDTY